MRNACACAATPRRTRGSSAIVIIMRAHHARTTKHKEERLHAARKACVVAVCCLAAPGAKPYTVRSRSVARCAQRQACREPPLAVQPRTLAKQLLGKSSRPHARACWLLPRKEGAWSRWGAASRAQRSATQSTHAHKGQRDTRTNERPKRGEGCGCTAPHGPPTHAAAAKRVAMLAVLPMRAQPPVAPHHATTIKPRLPCTLQMRRDRTKAGRVTQAGQAAPALARDE